ncbi:hypothetical protein [Polaromonas sp. CG9_12]|nr:hypothetical protein [Polaromonas sp. CG9_12]
MIGPAGIPPATAIIRPLPAAADAPLSDDLRLALLHTRIPDS